MAQPPGGGPDPARMAEMQQQRMDSLREQMEIKDDGEWKAVQPLIQKVMDSSRNVMRDRMGGGGMFGRGGGRRGGDNNNSAGDQGGGRRFRGGFMGEPSPEAEALQKAIDSKASKSELKAALGKVQEARKAHMAELEKTQADLRKVLSVNQEAVATLNGLL